MKMSQNQDYGNKFQQNKYHLQLVSVVIQLKFNKNPTLAGRWARWRILSIEKIHRIDKVK